jgi:hypothetical protein
MIHPQTERLAAFLLKYLNAAKGCRWTRLPTDPDFDSEWQNMRAQDDLRFRFRYDDRTKRFRFQTQFGDLDRHRITHGSGAEDSPDISIAGSKDFSKIAAEVTRRLIVPARELREVLIERAQEEAARFEECAAVARNLVIAGHPYAKQREGSGDRYMDIDYRRGRQQVDFRLPGEVTFTIEIDPYRFDCAIERLSMPPKYAEAVIAALATAAALKTASAIDSTA